MLGMSIQPGQPFRRLDAFPGSSKRRFRNRRNQITIEQPAVIPIRIFRDATFVLDGAGVIDPDWRTSCGSCVSRFCFLRTRVGTMVRRGSTAVAVRRTAPSCRLVIVATDESRGRASCYDRERKITFLLSSAPVLDAPSSRDLSPHVRLLCRRHGTRASDDRPDCRQRIVRFDRVLRRKVPHCLAAALHAYGRHLGRIQRRQRVTSRPSFPIVPSTNAQYLNLFPNGDGFVLVWDDANRSSQLCQIDRNGRVTGQTTIGPPGLIPAFATKDRILFSRSRGSRIVDFDGRPIRTLASPGSSPQAATLFSASRADPHPIR